MLNPLSIQNLQSSTGKSLSAAELVRALPLNTPIQISIRQSVPDPNQARQFNLQVQLGSQLYQLKSNQPLPPGSNATLTRTAAGQLLLSASSIAVAQGNLQLQTISQPATTQNKPVAQSGATAQPGSGQPLAPDQKPIVQIAGQRQQGEQGQQAQNRQGTPPPLLNARIPAEPPAQLNRLLPLNQPVLASLSVPISSTPATSTANPPQHNVQVRTNGRNLSLTINQPVPFDGKVLLIRTAPDQVRIQPLTSPVQNQNLQQTINEALRYVLPTQQPVADTLKQLQQIGSSTGGEKSPINSILNSIINLFGVKPEAQSPPIIRENLAHGGLFTERNLAAPKGQLVAGELKQQLGQLLQQADKLPDQPRQQLQELVQSLLNRVTSNQLESIQNTRVSNDGGIERFFALDLPIRHGNQLDNVELKISEHRHQVSEFEWLQTWRVRLHFDLQQQGTIDAELVLEDEHRITAHFWCSNQDTASELGQKLPDFNQQLRKQGYNIEALNCSEGQAPKALNRVEQLIDIST